MGGQWERKWQSLQQHGKVRKLPKIRQSPVGAPRIQFHRRHFNASQVGQLVRMREEEKLAHDVYVTLAQSSGLQSSPILRTPNHNTCEQFEQLASRYHQLQCKSTRWGFADPQFKLLYKSLVAAGNKSPIAAATVGAKIEEMDIKDLQHYCHRNSQDVAKVLEHLQRASDNTFARLLWN